MKTALSERLAKFINVSGMTTLPFMSNLISKESAIIILKRNASSDKASNSSIASIYACIRVEVAPSMHLNCKLLNKIRVSFDFSKLTRNDAGIDTLHFKSILLCEVDKNIDFNILN